MDTTVLSQKSKLGQFCVSFYGRLLQLENWLQIGELTLEYDSQLQLHPLFDREGVALGIILGVLIDTEQSRVVIGNVCLDVGANDPDLAQEVENQVYRYSGSWILILETENYSRIYLDPCGSLSLVYLSDKSVAASTTGLLLDDQAYVDNFDQGLYEALGVEKNGWFPAGLTAHHGVKRLLANHYLDLRSRQTKRHWPRQDFTSTLPLSKAAERISQLITAAVEAMKNDGPTVLAITGGKDSRMLLAGCRNSLANIDLITMDLPGSERDVYLAKKVTALGKEMKHSVLPCILASREERQTWRYKASHCVGGNNQYYSPSLKPLARYKYFISGICAEVGRGFLWRDTDYADLHIDTAELLARFGLKRHPRLDEPLANWANGVRSFNCYTVLDLAYTELRVSAWAYAHAYAYACKGSTTEISPFNSREIIEIFFSLAPEYRRSGAYIQEGISMMWPELLTIPFNRYGDPRDYWETIKALSDPARVASKARKIAGRRLTARK
ncbi:MAG: hypothetical protein KGY54_02050 [Oleiphilaceae bacterium]|nr:hypothetical protein [Oleiphilaceae bacterium]